MTEIYDEHELDAEKQDPNRNMKQKWQDYLMEKMSSANYSHR